MVYELDLSLLYRWRNGVLQRFVYKLTNTLYFCLNSCLEFILLFLSPILLAFWKESVQRALEDLVTAFPLIMLW